MSNKTRARGVFTSPRPAVRFGIIHTDGSATSYNASTYAPITNRRMGEEASITSSEGTDGAFRPCTHRRDIYQVKSLANSMPPYYVSEYIPTPINSTAVKTEYIYNMPQDHHAYYYSAFISAIGNAQTAMNLSTVDWSSLSTTALTTMLPTLGGENSLVNFLLELKDFKSLVKWWDGSIHKKVGVIESALGYRARFDKPLAKLSKSYLSYSFGWRPLYSDVVSLIQDVSTFTDRLVKLWQRSKIPQQKYFGTWVAGSSFTGATLLANGISGDGPTGGWIGPALNKIRCRAVIAKSDGIRYHATLRYRYEMPPGWRTVAGVLKGYLDLLGVSRNPATLWNAIPFTFIIDWVVNVSKYLNSLRVDNLDFKTEILGFCHSAKVERAVTFEMAGNDYHYVTGTSLHPFSATDHCQLSLYQRRVGLPNFRTALQTSGLDYREFTLTGALLGANIKRKN